MKPIPVLALLAAFTCHNSTVVAEAIWPAFRGVDGSASTKTGEPPINFKPGDALWKTELPPGSSSPVIWGDRIFVTAQAGDKALEVIAVNRTDGTIAWRQALLVEKFEPFFGSHGGSPAASSCATDGTHVVSYFGSLGLVCHDFAGHELWRVSMPLPQLHDAFGTGTSPIIHDGAAYLVRDEEGPGRGVFAFDVATGKPLWRKDRDGFHVSFGTPVVWDGTLAVIGDLRVKGYDLKTGEDRWVVRGTAAYPCTSPATGDDGSLYIATWSNGSSNEPNMPSFDQFLAQLDTDHDGKLSRAEVSVSGFRDFFDIQDKDHNGYIEREEWDAGLKFMARGKNVVLAIKPGGHGDITDTHVLWSSEKGAPYVSSPLFYQGRLYMAKDGGLVTAYTGATGKLLFEKQRLGADGEYYASPIGAGGHIYFSTLHGKVVVVKADDKLSVAATNDLGAAIAATPAVADGKLYIRSEKHLWAFGAK